MPETANNNFYKQEIKGLKAQVNHINHRMDKLDNRATHTHDNVADNYVALSKQLSNMSDRMNNKLDTVNGKFDTIDHKFDAINQRLNTLNSNMNQRFNSNTKWFAGTVIGVGVTAVLSIAGIIIALY